LFDTNVRSIRLGCCIGDPALAGVIRGAADYCELPVASVVMAGDVEDLGRRLAEAGCPPAAANVFLPGGLKIVGAEVDEARVDAYVAEGAARLERLRVRRLVFGSGQARAIPDGFDRARALDQLEAFVRRAAARMDEHGVTLVIEPLRRAESNVFNSVGEAAAFVRERGLAPARVLADLYHMREEGEGLDALDGGADLLAHTHVAGRERRPPGPGDDDVGAFLQRLNAAGYDGACSIECRWEDFATQAPAALAFLREEAARAGFS
jgi:D-psicose/D-tagatose/L-ribulose 3-epimerase